ncbi:MAG: 2Fe-2S iron-sulfur cluster binding domain-containing protein [Holosporales bacterium]|jgi:2Fe-2S ferredoxin|nr:2Fe-2S iron-sulfur cluster binding domain-containing protein [Holosporales bacterium]
MPTIIFKKGDIETKVEAASGETLLETANASGVKLFGGCSGAGVCGTCHVYIYPSFIDKIQKASDEEIDLLESLPNGNINSRLACQIVVSEELDGLTITIP